MVTHEAATTYNDKGATASDSLDGALSVTTNSEVDINKAGTYTVTYSAVDAAGNKADITRNVVVSDSTKPIITLIGGGTVNHEAATEYVDQGATAKDSLDGDLTVVTTGSVDVSKIGSYTITYNATDSAGNAAAEVKGLLRLVIHQFR